VTLYTAYRDARGNPPNLAILGFQSPDDTDLVKVRLFLKTAGPTYTLLETKGSHGVGGYTEGYYPFLTAVRGETYAVDLLHADGTATAKIDVDDVYFPPIPDPGRVWTNTAMIGVRHLRDVFLTVRQQGERAILLRRKASGQRCRCFDPVAEEAKAKCPYCYGIGFEGGYVLFRRMLMRFLPVGTKISATEIGFVVDSQRRGWAPIVPEIVDGDIVVRLLQNGTYRAFEVNNPTRDRDEGAGGIPTIQEFSLKVVETHMPVYKAIKSIIPSALLPPEIKTPHGVIQ